MEYPSDEARLMMIADMRKIIEKYENKLKHTNYRPIQVKGNTCKTESDIQGCLEADLITYDQYIKKCELLHARNSDVDKKKKDLKNSIEYLHEMIFNSLGKYEEWERQKMNGM